MPLEQPIATSTIVSQACRFLELAGVSSFGDESEQAQDLAEQYPVALRACLEHADWGFASELVALPQAVPDSTEAVDPRLPYAFVIPGDLVAVREVIDRCVHWRRDRRFLRASVSGPLLVRYTVFVTDEEQLPALFREAVAAKLATLLSPRHVGDLSRRRKLDDDAALALARAARQDARQSSSERWDGRDETGDWASEATQ